MVLGDREARHPHTRVGSDVLERVVEHSQRNGGGQTRHGGGMAMTPAGRRHRTLIRPTDRVLEGLGASSGGMQRTVAGTEPGGSTRRVVAMGAFRSWRMHLVSWAWPILRAWSTHERSGILIFTRGGATASPPLGLDLR